MSDLTPPETESTPEAGAPAAPAAPKTGRAVAPPSILQKATDQAIRPGFRNPPNSRSKAQKKAKKK